MPVMQTILREFVAHDAAMTRLRTANHCASTTAGANSFCSDAQKRSPSSCVCTLSHGGSRVGGGADGSKGGTGDSSGMRGAGKGRDPVPAVAAVGALAARRAPQSARGCTFRPPRSARLGAGSRGGSGGSPAPDDFCTGDATRGAARWCDLRGESFLLLCVTRLVSDGEALVVAAGAVGGVGNGGSRPEGVRGVVGEIASGVQRSRCKALARARVALPSFCFARASPARGLDVRGCGSRDRTGMTGDSTGGRRSRRRADALSAMAARIFRMTCARTNRSFASPSERESIP